MSSIIEYLKSPELVVQIQQWFGVKYLSTNCDDADDDDGSATTPIISEEEENFLNHVKNGKQHFLLRKQQRTNIVLSSANNSTATIESSSGSSETDEGFIEPNNHITNNQPVHQPKVAYVITNWFWYYVFVLGTELNDELFYATMIPFWFWNIDGAVGRRVCFMWSVCMYIGN